MAKFKTLEFEYTSYLDGDFVQHFNRPFLDINLSCGESESILTEAMVDSGCSHTHIDLMYAHELGIDTQLCIETKIGGICGDGIGFMTEMVEFQIQDCGPKFSGPAIFVKNLPFPVLLGQANFFEKFEVKFYRAKRKFSIKRVRI